jgi:hypothetical protein
MSFVSKPEDIHKSGATELHYSGVLPALSVTMAMPFTTAFFSIMIMNDRKHEALARISGFLTILVSTQKGNIWLAPAFRAAVLHDCESLHPGVCGDLHEESSL